MHERTRTWDANEAVAHVAYRTNEVISIYPITPASPMGEHADAWAAKGQPNLWGAVPRVIEMQSEGGAAGAVHGALQAGALTTTFTASQGLLLMIPNLYKIAGELTPVVLHVATRTVATHALSIFGDHSDVYACRQTGVAMLASGSVQEAHDLAAVAHAATLRSRVPFMHFFDGFRTSHELATTEVLADDDLRALVPDALVQSHRERALTPDRPVLRGTAQNPDVFFQAREAVQPFYVACPSIVQEVMDTLGACTGRPYRLFDYVGHPRAERVIVMMGSGAEAAHETVEWLVGRGEKVGLVKVRLYRPFSARHLAEVLPPTVKAVAALDRTKEPGSLGEPLYLDVLAGLSQARTEGWFEGGPVVVGGRYGLSSKELTPAMLVGVFDALDHEQPPHGFTVGIFDDVSGSSLPWDPDLDIESDDVQRAVFVGLGSDGTVSANKNSIKILGEETDLYAQGYFVYDSKKSGAVTVSHLRTSPRPIRATWLVRQASFVGCHQWSFLDRYDVLRYAAPGAVFLLNAPFPTEEVWDRLPHEVQQGLIDKGCTLYAIDAYGVAREAGMPGRINTIMQTCYFAISGVLPREEAIAQIKQAVEKTYGRKGERLVRMNFQAIDRALDHLHEIPVPDRATAMRKRPDLVPRTAPDFVQRVTARIMAGEGDLLPVSAFPPDGTWPTGTSKWEKRTIAERIPEWDPAICIQCNKCALVCPHAAIRVKVYEPEHLQGAPEGFKRMDWKGRDRPGQNYTVQVAPQDCTGCTLCAVVCPAKDRSNPRHKALDMAPLQDRLAEERPRFEFFLGLPEVDRASVRATVKDSQFLQPLFEFSGACAGCGETPYLKLITQLFGDRMVVANATGCSSIYGGNLPTTPWSQDAHGRGPAWSNSLFEDNAEFGVGMRLALDHLDGEARRLLQGLASHLDPDLVRALLDADQLSEEGIAAQRARVARLVDALEGLVEPDARRLEAIVEHLVHKDVWIVGGDGWAYDIGYGGLDHALASGLDINVLVLDTEVYSNTGGQSSKATPLGAVAKFAASGKGVPKKDLGMLAMAYGSVYVAQIAIDASDAQALKALIEAESYPGPSLVLAYSQCIAHGYDLADGPDQQKKAVASGFWPLYRFDPRNPALGKPALSLDSKAPKLPLQDFEYGEARFRVLQRANPDRARLLLEEAQADVEERYARLEALARMTTPATATE